jgi:hypothetical protein
VGLPLHEPEDAVIVCPACAVPLSCGNDVFVGADRVAAATAPVAADVAVAEPPVFAAVTATRSVVPASTDTSRYEAAPAPAIDAQLFPTVSQRFHWYAYELGLPFHEPVVAVSV